MSNTIESPERRLPPPRSSESGTGSGATLLRVLLLAAGVVALGFAWGLSAIVVVLALIVMIFLHELGHYLMAKRAGMKVTEFFIGFGPTIWSFRRGETEYGLKLVPAGAYVRIIGMHNLDEVDPADEHRAYRQKSFPARLSVAVAGSTMHFLLALALLFTLFSAYGERRADHWEIGAISRLGDEQTSPALKAGLQLGDRLLAVDGTPVGEFDDLRELVGTRPGDTVTLRIERDGRELETEATLADRNPDGERVGFLGVGPTYPFVGQPVLESVGDTFTEFGRVTKASVVGLGRLFSPDGISGYVDNLTGDDETSGEATGGVSEDDANRPLSPVGAVRIASQAADQGVPELLLLLVAINVFVGVFNLVPLLPFDGGHVALAVYERVRSRRGRPYHADVAKLLPLTYAVVVVLGLLFVTSTYIDLADPIGNPFEP